MKENSVQRGHQPISTCQVEGGLEWEIRSSKQLFQQDAHETVSLNAGR